MQLLLTVRLVILSENLTHLRIIRTKKFDVVGS